MEMIHRIREKFKRRQYEFSKHAVDQSIIRDISVAEVEDSITNRSEVIEDYPDDKYGPSCLILGTRKWAGHCIFNAAIRAEHWSRLSPCTSPTPICGSIFGSECEMEGYLS